METKKNDDFWLNQKKEAIYPERDMEFISWYPVNLSSFNGNTLLDKLPGIFLYIHIPFCSNKCNYCPFNVVINATDDLIDKYVDGLIAELNIYKKNNVLNHRICDFIMIGGGTPSCLSENHIEKLMEAINAAIELRKDAIVSIEVNPNTVTESKLKKMLECGINRLSIGVQSFNDDVLKMLGRPHKAEKSIETIKRARKLGFKDITIDLMYRIPGQSLKDWENELEIATQQDIDHITTFSLRLVPVTKLFGSVMNNTVPEYPSEQIDAEMHELAVLMLTKAGFIHYAIDDYAKEGKEFTWTGRLKLSKDEEHIGLGAGGFSYFRNYCYHNVSRTDKYLEDVNNGNLPISQGIYTTPREQMARQIIFSFKTLKVNKKFFFECWGIDINSIFGKEFYHLKELALIDETEEYYCLTPKGEIYINNVCKTFFSEENRKMWQPEIQSKESYFPYYNKIIDCNKNEVVWDEDAKELFEWLVLRVPPNFRNEVQDGLISGLDKMVRKFNKNDIGKIDVASSYYFGTPLEYKSLAEMELDAKGIRIKDLVPC